MMPMKVAAVSAGVMAGIAALAAAACIGGSYPQVFGWHALLSRVHGQTAFREQQSVSQVPRELGAVVQAIDPPQASSLPITQLADLVTLLIPPSGFEQLGWEYLENDPSIHWLTSGYADGEIGAERDGLVRVRVGSRESTRLLQNTVELAWSVTLTNDGNPKFGPDGIEVEVGYSPRKQCFGTLDNGCTFTAEEALSSTKLKTQLVCDVGGAGEKKQVFIVSTVGKASALVVIITNEGSGGASSTLSILPEAQQSKLCSRS